MAKAGWAEVYDNAGAEYGGLERELRQAVETAKYPHNPSFWGVLTYFLGSRGGGCGLRI
jgi:hypothetical protein